MVWCECCAFPVVAGIPVLKSDAAKPRTAMQASRPDGTRTRCCRCSGSMAERGDAFRAMVSRDWRSTYRDAIRVLSPDPEGTYFIYRFSDPTFVLAEAVLSALGQEPAVFRGPGARSLRRFRTPDARAQLASGLPTASLLADMFFWKLWLAKRFTAPRSLPVCCDANQPLPFARGIVSDRRALGRVSRTSGTSGCSPTR